MEITYELNQRDFFDCFIAHRKRSALSRWIHLIGSIILVLLVGLTMFNTIVIPGKSILDSVQILIPIGLWILVLWGMPWWNAQNQFKKQPSEKGPKKAEVDSAAFIGMERGVQLSMSGKTS